MNIFTKQIPKIVDIKTIKENQFGTRKARLNWIHHLKPIIRSVLYEFHESLKDLKYDTPFYNCLSDSVSSGEPINSDKSLYGDSISIQYGHTIVTAPPTFKKDDKLEALFEDGATLTFSMSINGSVLAFIYPPKTNFSKTKRSFYLIGEWRNSSEISKRDVGKMFLLLLKIQTHCRVYSHGKTSQKILVHLAAKDASIRNGTNPIFRYLDYIKYLIKGIRQIHGIGTPHP